MYSVATKHTSICNVKQTLFVDSNYCVYMDTEEAYRFSLYRLYPFT